MIEWFNDYNSSFSFSVIIVYLFMIESFNSSISWNEHLIFILSFHLHSIIKKFNDNNKFNIYIAQEENSSDKTWIHHWVLEKEKWSHQNLQAKSERISVKAFSSRWWDRKSISKDIKEVISKYRQRWSYISIKHLWFFLWRLWWLWEWWFWGWYSDEFGWWIFWW